MASFEELAINQSKTGERIETIIRNFKKDPATRKESVSYFEERLRRLDEEWATFETTDNKIRLLENLPLEHKYFTEDYYRAIMEVVQQYKEIFEAAILKVAPRSTIKPPTAHEQQSNRHHTSSTDASLSKTEEVVKLRRRQSAMMRSLERLLADNFSNEDTIAATRLWQKIEDLHYQIAELDGDSIVPGHELEQFIRLERELRNASKSLTSSLTNEINSGWNNRHPESVTMPIPKITLPKFDGDYLKWKEFHDLFSSLIIMQPITNVEKMWYLKTHLVGEAANLVKHFASTGENFEAAWAIIIQRYNNKRLLVSKLIQELVDTPNKTVNDNYKSLHDKTRECLLSLQNLQIETSTWDPLLLHLLLKRLDQATRLRYEQSLLQPREVPTIKGFLEFLERHFQSTEAMVEKEKSTYSRQKVCTSTITPERNNACNMCKNGKHPLFACREFLELSTSARLQWVQKQRYCVNCLKPGHNAKSCLIRGCKQCNKKHNTLLHLGDSNQRAAKTPLLKNIPRTQAVEEHTAIITTTSSSRQNATSLAASKSTESNNYVLLGTAIIKVRANEKEIQCRALLDSGSQLNLVSERLIKRLGIPVKPASIFISGVGSHHTRVQRRVNVDIHSRITNFNTRLEAAVLPQIISPQPSRAINTSHWTIPNNIALADPEFNRPNKIDVLLGAEFYHQLLAIGQIQLGKDLPTLQNTVLGWVIAGKIGDHRSSTAACGICTEEDTSLERDIAKLWELETLQPTDRHLSESEKQCERHFTQTHSIHNSGRFMVRIPFCSNPEILGDSHGIAYNRFLSLERRLSKTPEIKNQYRRFMREYETLGHMTQIDKTSMCKPSYFIPHHCVLRPDSLTTKLRVVFDASTKTSGGSSLNDLMHIGPTVQSDLFSILLRFRLPRFVFTTDIEKMYRQILIHPDDRRFQVILWREDPSMPIKHYQLNTVTYGTRSAPYLATKCLEKIANDNKRQYPYGAQFLRESFYVDDGIGGDDDLTTALAIQRELKVILNQHGLQLQKWTANHPQLLQNVREQQEFNFDFNKENNHMVKTLGLTWMPKLDKFSIKVTLQETKTVTKRTIISDVAKLFDPLGLLSPIVVTAKMFIQELWLMRLDWDEELPLDLHTRWLTFRKDLELLNNLQISRHIFEEHIPSNTQIHAFADASEKAYGAAVYIRSVVKNKQVIVRLLCAKSRVAPLKRQTLPRLELCAALLSAQLTERVKRDLKLETTPTYLWTDSEIVLAWINSQSSSYHSFVANRISAIQEVSSSEQWRHVRSKENPADILSRGLPPKNLAGNSLWFYGPIFLHGQRDIWPQKHHAISNNVDMEQKKTTSLTTVKDDSASIIYQIHHNGSFRTLQRVVGYMVRFANNARKRTRQVDLALSVEELETSLTIIIRAIQQADFEEDLKQLTSHKEVRKGSPHSNLTPFIDSKGIIRVGGRLDSSLLPFDAKHPMLIPYNDPITKLLMQMIHEQNRHCGPQALLAHVRQRYWPVKGKTAARSIVKHCIRCTRAKPALLNQIMGNLPAPRVTPARPFINSGVDFCGPVWIHYKVRGKKPHKAYIAVFCCFATKAVHLELVSDLTTEAFIGALKRFISRRGHCLNLYCDNATNFIGAKNQLNELSDAIYTNPAHDKITKECTARGIMFKCIPPRAPHFGGLWEAAVKSAKHLLVRSVATASLTYEELDTVIIEIEGILNSRPISPMSDNPNDLAALTPGHFLIGEPLNAQVDAGSTEPKISQLTRWKLVTHLKTEFWRRWSREYLCELQYRHKWKTQKDNLKPGDMVVVKEDNAIPLKWPLGRVVKVHQGDDGFIRVADVKTANGVFRRPIARLAPLPISNTDSGKESPQGDINEATTSQSGEDGNETITGQNEIPKKRKRTAINNNMVTMIMTVLLIPLVLGAKVNHKRFGNHLGIHFEGIGSASISSTDWQLLIYYDLKEFWAESTIFSRGTESLNQLCQEIRDKTTCISLVSYFKHTEAEFKVDSALLSGRIKKRGAIDLVGNIAHSLFGVLDSEYAKDMAQTISQVKENEAYLLNLLRNQTSVIDSTLNIMKSDQENVKKKFDQIDSQMMEVQNMIRDEKHQERIYHIFFSLCIQLTVIAANLQQTQSSILDVLTNTHHGIISPLLLTPYQLQNEVEKIRMHLPESLELPVRQENILQLYKIMKVKGGLTENTVIFSITLPLTERDRFEIFNVVPVPNWVNNTLVAIKPCSPLLIISIVGNKYFTISNTQFNKCSLIKEDMYLCSIGQMRYDQGAPTCACEMNLFLNQTQPRCPVEQIEDNTTWISLRHRNKWIYAVPSASQATAVCKKEITQIILQGSGLLDLDPDCTLKHKFTTIQGQQAISSSLKTSYTSLWEITKLSHEERANLVLKERQTSEYISQVQNLTALQASLAAQKILQLPNKIDAHNYHHMSVGYTALITTIGILIYLVIKKKCSQRSSPIPAPRQQQSTSEFTVHI